MTGKQKIFADALLNNPKLSGKDAALLAYGKDDKPISGRTAEVMASENLRKPEIMAYLEKHVDKAQQVVIEAMSANRKVFKQDHETNAWVVVDTEPDHQTRLRAADSLLDRIHGKATQRVQMESTKVELRINLFGDQPDKS